MMYTFKTCSVMPIRLFEVHLAEVKQIRHQNRSIKIIYRLKIRTVC